MTQAAGRAEGDRRPASRARTATAQYSEDVAKDIVLTQDPPRDRADRQGRHDHAVPVAGPGALPGAGRGRQGSSTPPRASSSRPSSSVTQGADRVQRQPARGRRDRAPTRRSAPSSSPATQVHRDGQQGPRADHRARRGRQEHQRGPARSCSSWASSRWSSVQGRATSPRTGDRADARRTAPASRRARRSSSRSARARRWSSCRGVIGLPCQQAPAGAAGPEPAGPHRRQPERHRVRGQNPTGEHAGAAADRGRPCQCL